MGQAKWRSVSIRIQVLLSRVPTTARVSVGLAKPAESMRADELTSLASIPAMFPCRLHCRATISRREAAKSEG